MDDPIQRHPTRAEQLDILTTLIARRCQPGDRVLDLGCGTGYLAYLLADKRPGLVITGADIDETSLASARETASRLPVEFEPVRLDLTAPGEAALPFDDYAVACTCLTFHDLPDPAKREVVEWVGRHLRPGGVFFIYDRLRLEHESLFVLQRDLWDRMQRRYGRGMRTAASFAEYEADIGPANQPARLSDYLDWYEQCGFDAQCVHLHGNVALLAGARR